MRELIPPFDFKEVIVDPWAIDWRMSLWVVLIGILINCSCGLLGTFLVLRRMALTGDAISHSVLPGLVGAYILLGSLDSTAMLAGAAVAGAGAVWLIEFIQERSRVKSDAATGIAFTSLFALGVLLIGRFADRAHLDVECVLYGALETTVFEQIPTPAGPVPVAAITLGVVGLIVVAAVALFYKELLIGSFDPALAAALGLRPRLFHYLLMSLVAVVVVASLRSVGAVLVVGMIILPSATARFFSDRLRPILWLGVLFSFVSAVMGRHLAEWWNCPIAAAMAVASGMLFFTAWLIRACSRLWRWLA